MDKNMEIIKVEQLPVITERLHEIKAKIEAEAEALTSLEVSDETLQIAKNARANFNKILKDLDDRRKAVKKIAMQPIDKFEETFKECITEPGKQALAKADAKIAMVTVKRTEEKMAKAKEYYGKIASESGLEWLEFDRLGVKVNASDSDSKIYGAIDDVCDKIASDVKLIMMGEYADEVMYEFKKSLNAIKSTMDVMERHKALEDAKPVAKDIMSDDDILDAVMDDIAPADAPKMVVFEKPKKEYRFKFYLDEDEYVKFVQANKMFEYEEV